MLGNFNWDWITDALGAGTFLTGVGNLIFAWRRDRGERNLEELRRIANNATVETHGAFQADTAVTQLDFLISGMWFRSKREARLCKSLYDIGKKQFDHSVNNRSGAIRGARQSMADLRKIMAADDIRGAETLGIELARADSSKLAEVERRLEETPANTRLYAMHKKTEEETTLSIARDLEKGIPVTDYTEVKDLMAAGASSLSEVFGELPIPWQKIREIPWPGSESIATARKPIYIPTSIHHAKLGLLYDKKAEPDGDWIVSHKYGVVYPYLGPTSVYEFRGEPPHFVKVREEYVITSDDYPPEWDTKLWGKGGYLDEALERAARGEDPPTLRHRRLRRRIRLAFGSLYRALCFGLATVVVQMYF